MKNQLMRLFKEPLLQFMFVGACIYGAYAWYGPTDEGMEERQVQVDTGMIDGFIREWERRWNRPPTAEELDGMIANYVRETILYQQALAPGQWHGPVLSGDGVHLAYIAAIEIAPEVAVADVRERVLQDGQVAQQEQFNAAYFARLKESYHVDIADIPQDRIFHVRADAQAGDAVAQEPAS